MPRIRHLMLGLAAIAIVGVLALALRARPVDVEVARVVRAHFEAGIVEDGKTRVRERYTIVAPVAGTLLRIGLKAGDTVTAGDVVASILPNLSPLLDARARQEAEQRLGAAEAAEARTAALVVQAEATATQARVDAERSRTLVAQGAAPRSRQEHDDLTLNTTQRAWEAARFAHHAAEHEVELARSALIADDVAREGVTAWQIRSPVGGRVLRMLQESETPVALGAPLLQVGDPTDIEVVADFLTTDAVRIHPGDAAWIEDWGGDTPLRGKVRVVEPGGFTRVSALGVDEQRTNVVVDIVEPPAARPTLADGYRVDARVVVATLDNAVVVPVGALFRDREGWAVFAVVDGVARRRTVVLSQRADTTAAVQQGLEPGDTVILFPTDAIAEGVRVRPR
jgi:HlyD family secretion protein